MTHRLGVSGSTILSDPTKYDELFWEGIEHIEIGEFPDEAAFSLFLKHCQEHRLTFGVHSPLYRHQSKYDLIEYVYFEPEQAWYQLEHEMKLLNTLGAEYILVHFPYFKGELDGDAQDLITGGLERIKKLQDKYSLPVICEPKLGLHRSPAGIQYFHHSLKEHWNGIGICIDIGDFLIATGDQIVDIVEKWHDMIQVVHLHNVEFVDDDKYWWIPVHPSHENDGIHYKIEDTIRSLAKSTAKTFVFEHTPHINSSTEFIQQGYHWIRQLVK